MTIYGKRVLGICLIYEIMKFGVINTRKNEIRGITKCQFGICRTCI